jgi:hypothetical protein
VFNRRWTTLLGELNHTTFDNTAPTFFDPNRLPQSECNFYSIRMDWSRVASSLRSRLTPQASVRMKGTKNALDPAESASHASPALRITIDTSAVSSPKNVTILCSTGMPNGGVHYVGRPRTFFIFEFLFSGSAPAILVQRKQTVAFLRVEAYLTLQRLITF